MHDCPQLLVRIVFQHVGQQIFSLKLPKKRLRLSINTASTDCSFSRAICRTRFNTGSGISRRYTALLNVEGPIDSLHHSTGSGGLSHCSQPGRIIVVHTARTFSLGMIKPGSRLPSPRRHLTALNRNMLDIVTFAHLTQKTASQERHRAIYSRLRSYGIPVFCGFSGLILPKLPQS